MWPHPRWSRAQHARRTLGETVTQAAIQGSKAATVPVHMTWHVYVVTDRYGSHIVLSDSKQESLARVKLRLLASFEDETQAWEASRLARLALGQLRPSKG